MYMVESTLIFQKFFEILVKFSEKKWGKFSQIFFYSGVENIHLSVKGAVVRNNIAFLFRVVIVSVP